MECTLLQEPDQSSEINVFGSVDSDEDVQKSWRQSQLEIDPD